MKKDQDFLADTTPETAFYLNSGQYLNNLDELNSALKGMDPNTFKHHVNSEKNDFHSWITDVIQDHTLADSIKRVKSQKTLSVRLKSRIEDIMHKKNHKIVVKKKNGCLSVKAVKKSKLKEKPKVTKAKASKTSAKRSAKKPPTTKKRVSKAKTTSKKKK